MECTNYNIAVGHGTGLIKLVLVHDKLHYASMVLNPQDAQRLASHLLLASNNAAFSPDSQILHLRVPGACGSRIVLIESGTGKTMTEFVMNFNVLSSPAQ